jgi:uncharacterized protein YkwD
MLKKSLVLSAVSLVALLSGYAALDLIQPSSVSAANFRQKCCRKRRPAQPAPTAPSQQPAPPAVQPPQFSPPNTSSNSMPEEMLAAHNQVRSQLGLTPLQWSSALTAQAQDWANYLASSGTFQHRPSNSNGENLFWSGGGSYSPTKVVAFWAGESKNYNADTNSCNGICGHYTQLVWRNTTEVGCAVAQANDQAYWVCNYNPPGNYVGQRPY